MHRIHIGRLVLALTAAAVLAQAALAGGGERKNEPPFTRHTPRVVAAVVNANSPDVRGEAKNQLPFTRRAAR